MAWFSPELWYLPHRSDGDRYTCLSQVGLVFAKIVVESSRAGGRGGRGSPGLATAAIHGHSGRRNTSLLTLPSEASYDVVACRVESRLFHATTDDSAAAAARRFRRVCCLDFNPILATLPAVVTCKLRSFSTRSVEHRQTISPTPCRSLGETSRQREQSRQWACLAC